MKQLMIEIGSMVMIGRPRTPVSPEMAKNICDKFRAIEGIAEAHLPQLFAVGAMETPAQVLVVIPNEGVSAVNLAIRMTNTLADGPDGYFVVLESSHPSVAKVRGAQCQIPLASGAN